MRWYSKSAAKVDVAIALVALGLCLAALLSGLGVQSFAFLGAGIWWLVMSRYWAGRARASDRHRELRHRRLERERRGTAPPRGRR